MTNTPEILALYDYERRHAEEFGFRREESDGLVRSVGLAEAIGWVSYSHADEASADDAIEAQKRYFSALGYGFEWKWYAHDHPADLRQRLIDHGFDQGDEETIVVLDLNQAPAGANPMSDTGRSVRKVRDSDELRRVFRAVHGSEVDTEYDNLLSGLSRELEAMPELLGIYCALEGDVPVSIGWLRLPPAGFHFASLWGGSTAPAFRRRGHYSALVAARVTEARKHGARFLTVDALPTSRPILEKLGFQILTTTAPMTWPPESTP